MKIGAKVVCIVIKPEEKNIRKNEKRLKKGMKMRLEIDLRKLYNG